VKLKALAQLGWMVCGGAAMVAAAVAAEAPASLAEVAFVSIRSGDAQIYTRDSNGQVRAVTSGKGVHTQPAWSADNRVAFAQRVGAVAQVFFTDTDGAAPQRLTAGARMELSPSWSPDGQRVALYSRPAEGGIWELQIVDVATRQVRVLTTHDGEMGPTPVSWSADGTRLAFVLSDKNSKTQVWVAQTDGSQIRQLGAKISPRGGAAPNLSPDGRKLVWVGDIRPARPLIVTDADTDESVVLTTEALSANESPRWSPDGTQIVFASLRDNTGYGRNDIFVMNADGSQVRNISRHEAEDFDPKWSADGKSVVYASLRTGTSLLYEVQLSDLSTRPISMHSSHDMDHVIRPQALKKLSSSAKAP
jgi:TolB protein